MVDRGNARDVNEAARRFAETLAESYRVVYGQAAESGERQQRLAQEFSELVANNLREHRPRADARVPSDSPSRPTGSRRPAGRWRRSPSRPTWISSTPPSPSTGRVPSRPQGASRRGRWRVDGPRQAWLELRQAP